MDNLGFNKIAAAILATALGFMLIKEIPHLLMHTEAPEKPIYPAELPDAQGPADVIEDLPFPQESWIAGMDATRGAKVFKKCTSCHNADNGGANGTGPNLWDVVGAPVAQKDGFGYSAAMTNSGIVWDYETLDGYLTKPTKFLPGTNMNFVGLKKDTDRAAVIEYLRLAANTPIPQPTAATMGEEADLIEEISEGAEEVTETVVEATEDVVDGTQEAAEDVVEGAKELVEDAGQAVEETAEEAVEAGKDLLEKAKDKVEEVVDDGN